ncbi:MAG: hypothetical protein HC913_03920, partial [Microscillaceae bacterium]|nr:hypothetical protein [Microscillaceae bacterium]
CTFIILPVFRRRFLAKPDSLPASRFDTIFVNLPAWLAPHNGPLRETPSIHHLATFLETAWHALKPAGQMWVQTASWQLSSENLAWLQNTFAQKGQVVNQIRQEINPETSDAEQQAWEKAQAEDLQLRIFHVDADGRHFACHRPENGPWFLITTLPSANGPLPVKILRLERSWKILQCPKPNPG